MPVIDHIHSYRRVGKSDKFHCTHPVCTHYTQKEFLIGKYSLCKCGEKFILDYRALQLKFPHCIECLKPYKPDSRQALLKKKELDKIANQARIKEVIIDEIIPQELLENGDPGDNSGEINEAPRKRIGYEI